MKIIEMSAIGYSSVVGGGIAVTTDTGKKFQIAFMGANGGINKEETAELTSIVLAALLPARSGEDVVEQLARKFFALHYSDIPDMFWETISENRRQEYFKEASKFASLLRLPEAVPGWLPIETAPKDGAPFYLRVKQVCRFQPYKPNSQERRKGKSGRWQLMNEYGGWDNCDDLIGEWSPTAPAEREG